MQVTKMVANFIENNPLFTASKLEDFQQLLLLGDNVAYEGSRVSPSLAPGIPRDQGQTPPNLRAEGP